MDMAAGHNSELTPKERKWQMMYHMRAIAAQVAICDRENAERKRLRKLAKQDGIALADIDYGLRILKIDDPDIIVSEQRRRQELADWFGLPVFTQAEFSFEREPAIDAARREGSAAGAMAKDDVAPYADGTAQAAAWHEGWRKAQDEMLEAFASIKAKRMAAQLEA